jgi:hypothetical protein
VAFKRCEGLDRARKECRSRNNKAVWMVDGKLFCGSCFEHYLETHSIDEARIHRLSDREVDFSETARQYTARA